jgi:hypothetical protein
MVNVAHITKKIINEKPFLLEALSRGIINQFALAEDIKTEVEKELGKEVKVSAVNMAIRRLAEKTDTYCINEIDFGSDVDLTIKSNLILYNLNRTWETQKKVKEIYSLSEGHPGQFLNIIQGPYEIAIITNESNEKKIESTFEEQEINKKKNNIAGITLKLPQESTKTPGYLFSLVKAIFWENLNIVELFSTFTELTLIFEEKDVARAFETIRKLVVK